MPASDHLRQQFLDRLSGTTLLNLTTTGTRVYVGRITPLSQDASPSLLLDLGEESTELAEILHGRQAVLDRSLELIVHGAVKAVSGYIATLNTIALEVEVAIAGDQSLGGLCKYVRLAGIGEPILEGQGEKPVALMSMRFIVRYMAALNAPQTPR